jgi:hypothetical protein
MQLVLMIVLLAQTAAATPAPPPTTPMEWFRLARTHAAAGEKEKAFEALQQAVSRGFSSTAMLNAENDLLPLRTDARWPELVATARRNQHPCRSAPEFRQLDYWLGEWDVLAQGQKIAQSSIQLALNDCVIFENYLSIDNSYAGKSFSLWNAATKKWEQQYVDTTGRFTHWTGGLADGTMVMTTESAGATQRMSYIKDGPDKVRQLIEVSTDGGKTWSAGYDGVYLRRR